LLYLQSVFVRGSESCKIVVKPVHLLAGTIGEYEHTCLLLSAVVSEDATRKLRNIIPSRGRHPPMLAIDYRESIVTAFRYDQRCAQPPVKPDRNTVDQPTRRFIVGRSLIGTIDRESREMDPFNGRLRTDR